MKILAGFILVGYSWGNNKGAPVPESPASDLIIKEALVHSPGNKLNIICLGAVTNVAAAILKNSGIAANVLARGFSRPGHDRFRNDRFRTFLS